MEPDVIAHHLRRTWRHIRSRNATMGCCAAGYEELTRPAGIRVRPFRRPGPNGRNFSWIQEGTVFRSDTPVPYDHASIPATLRDWLDIPEAKMLPSLRVRNAPTLGQVVTLTKPRTELPSISRPAPEAKETASFFPANSLQRGLVAADAVRRGNDPHRALSSVVTKKDAIEYFSRPHASGNMVGSKTI